MSAAGQKALTERWEGRRARMYHDGGGVPTIGVGHAIKSDESWMLTATLTDQQIDELFRKDVAWAEAAVARLFPHIKRQNQFDALVDFTFNLGATQVEAGTLDNLIEEGAKAEDISAKWMQYHFDNGHPVQGLLNRRQDEVYWYWQHLWKAAIILILIAAAMLATGGTITLLT